MPSFLEREKNFHDRILNLGLHNWNYRRNAWSFTKYRSSNSLWKKCSTRCWTLRENWNPKHLMRFGRKMVQRYLWGKFCLEEINECLVTYEEVVPRTWLYAISLFQNFPFFSLFFSFHLSIKARCNVRKVTFFPSPAGMSQTKLSLTVNNLIVPGHGQGKFG